MTPGTGLIGGQQATKWHTMNDSMQPDAALVLFSGGQDSTTCLAWALDRFAAVETVGFAYGQRHAIELDCRPALLDELRKGFPAWRGKLGPDHSVDLGVIAELSESALTSEAAIAMGAE